MIRIPLDLYRHCLQTETRRQYNRLLSACLKNPDTDELAEKKLELLRQALETWDFPALRAAHRELAGGQENEVALAADEAGRLFILLNGRAIEPR